MSRIICKTTYRALHRYVCPSPSFDDDEIRRVAFPGLPNARLRRGGVVLPFREDRLGVAVALSFSTLRYTPCSIPQPWPLKLFVEPPAARHGRSRGWLAGMRGTLRTRTDAESRNCVDGSMTKSATARFPPSSFSTMDNRGTQQVAASGPRPRSALSHCTFKGGGQPKAGTSRTTCKVPVSANRRCTILTTRPYRTCIPSSSLEGCRICGTPLCILKSQGN
jgi:hypothetical protein